MSFKVASILTLYILLQVDVILLFKPEKWLTNFFLVWKHKNLLENMKIYFLKVNF